MSLFLVTQSFGYESRISNLRSLDGSISDVLFKAQAIPAREVAAFRNEETKLLSANISHAASIADAVISSADNSRSAADHLLKAMGLDDLSVIQPFVIETSDRMSFFKHPYRVVRIVLPSDLETDPRPLFPEGLAILPHELGPTRAFELLYREGRLIGIYAVPFQTAASHQRFRQMDLTHLYLVVPVSDHPDARQRWQALVRQWEDDFDVITSYRRMTDPIGETPDFFGDSMDLRFLKVEINKDSGETQVGALMRADVWNAGRIDQFMDRLLEIVTGVHKFILPVVPGVFVTVGYRLGAGLAHYRNLYRAALRYAADIATINRDTYKTLVIGPGTGVDSCILQLVTGQNKLYTIGSASENANTKTTAQANGFDTESRVHDNIVSPQGSMAYPGERFHLISWFMPWIDRRGRADTDSLQFADKNGIIFHQFVRSLPQVLAESENARVMIGNIPQPDPGVKNEVIEAFEDSGFVLVQEDSVPKEGFYVFKRAPLSRTLHNHFSRTFSIEELSLNNSVAVAEVAAAMRAIREKIEATNRHFPFSERLSNAIDMFFILEQRLDTNSLFKVTTPIAVFVARDTLRRIMGARLLLGADGFSKSLIKTVSGGDAVDPTEEGHGIGTALRVHAFEWMKKHNLQFYEAEISHDNLRSLNVLRRAVSLVGAIIVSEVPSRKPLHTLFMVDLHKSA